MLIMTPRWSFCRSTAKLTIASTVSMHVNICQCFEFNMFNDGVKSCGDVYNLLYISNFLNQPCILVSENFGTYTQRVKIELQMVLPESATCPLGHGDGVNTFALTEIDQNRSLSRSSFNTNRDGACRGHPKGSCSSACPSRALPETHQISHDLANS